MTLGVLLGALVFGLAQGGAIALLGAGIVTIHRGSGVLNIAQGAMGMFATYIAVGVIGGSSTHTDRALILGAFTGVLAGAGLGMLVDRLVMRPLTGRSPIVRMTATLGVLYILVSFAQMVWGASTTRTVPSLFGHGGQHIGTVIVSNDAIEVAIVALLLSVELGLFYQRPGLGTAIRALRGQPRRGQARRHPRRMARRGVLGNGRRGRRDRGDSCPEPRAEQLHPHAAGRASAGRGAHRPPATSPADPARWGRHRCPHRAHGDSSGACERERSAGVDQPHRRPGRHRAAVDDRHRLGVAAPPPRHRGQVPNGGEPRLKVDGAVRAALVLGAVALVAFVPLSMNASGLYLLTIGGAYAVVILSLVVVTGMAGQFSLAQRVSWVSAHLPRRTSWSTPTFPIGLRCRSPASSQCRWERSPGGSPCARTGSSPRCSRWESAAPSPVSS